MSKSPKGKVPKDSYEAGGQSDRSADNLRGHEEEPSMGRDYSKKDKKVEMSKK